jgi:hypothetical protein
MEIICVEAYQTVKQVLRLDISMDHVFGVEVLQGLAHLPDVVGSCRLLVPLIRLLLQVLVEFASRGVLKNQVYLLVVPEEAIHPENVLMPQVRLNLYLSAQLVLHIRFEKLLFVQDLQRNNEL